ncbi:FAD/NAD(P)-binding protein [Leucobacter tardus]|uniref:FAD/NAD(P)-binding protein n=1 Tax=Leucobacter tardus TaxID=501483 RepID=A0A939QHK1_9MICO|nr:FAD/NAD(P)-binding protein [Leucobacter tardus]MBO2990218.1 FAD/NAD(P)-binding protein [Leucobacter tardus]
MLAAPRPAIALIGAGPRGASLIERIGANAPADATFDLHVVDDAPDGAGAIWRTDQTRELCMNTLSDAVTLFTEPSSTVTGPVVEGPTLYEWSLLALHDAFPSPASAAVVAEIPEVRAHAFHAFPVRAGLAADYRTELETTRPESHPSRALYGEYLAWCYDRAVSHLPAGVHLVRHRTRAVGIERTNARSDRTRERIALADGRHVDVDTVILATGWMPRTETPIEAVFSRTIVDRPELTWVRPASPVDQDLSGVGAGEHVIIRGLGMGFFDTMSLLTIERGGRFVPDPDAASGLRYIASGAEPVLHATSHRGVPFRAKTLYGSLPPAPEQRFLRGEDWAARRRPIDFNREVWPRIVADAYLDHATVLHRTRPEAFDGVALDEVRTAIEQALAELLGTEDAGERLRAGNDLAATAMRIEDAVAVYLADPADRFGLPGEMQPVHEEFDSPAAFDAWVAARTAADLREAELGWDSAVKAGLWSISAARGAAGAIGANGGFDAESRRTGFATLMSVGGMAGSGPPAFRNRQLLALVDAGLVHFIGPRAQVEVDESGFRAESLAVSGSALHTRVLIDAWMHFHDLSETADSLAAGLLASGRARVFTVAMRESDAVIPTGGFAIDPETGLLIGADGDRDAAIHVAGIPIDEQLHGMIISPMPGTDPPMLRETDRVARSALRIAAAAHEDAGAPAPNDLEGALHA